MVSTDTLAVGSPIGLGNTPDALAVNPVTNKIYVANGSVLTVIDGASNTIRTTTQLPLNGLTAVAVNPVTNFIYVTATPGVGTLFAVNGATDTLLLSNIALIGNSPLALAVNSLTNRIYVTDNGNPGNVVVIDGSTNNRVGSFPTNGNIQGAKGTNPGAVAVNPVTNRVYVANNGIPGNPLLGGNLVVALDGATRTTDTIQCRKQPERGSCEPGDEQGVCAQCRGRGQHRYSNRCCKWRYYIHRECGNRSDGRSSESGDQ